MYSNYESVLTRDSLVVIEVPPKVWRPKVQNKYIPLDYTNDEDEGVIYFKQYGKAEYRPKKNRKKVVMNI